MSTRSRFAMFMFVAVAVIIMEACASPQQIVTDAMEQLARSPHVEVVIEATPCGISVAATSSASVEVEGVEVIAMLTITARQACEAASSPAAATLPPIKQGESP